MYFWIVSISMALADPACLPVDHAGWIQAVQKSGREDAYLCLADDDKASASLLGAIAAVEEPGSGQQRRLQRALALHVMQHLDEPASLEALRAVNASDRRLLRDAVHARRGRTSPVAEHAAVFEKFAWYRPDPRFTNRSLTQLDTANLTIIDRPPRAESSTSALNAPAIAAMPRDAGAAPQPANTTGGCACTTTHAPLASGWLALSLAGLLVRRGRPSAVEQDRAQSTGQQMDILRCHPR
jgi:hypothetical protein